MQVPALLYGPYGDVRKRCRKAIMRFARGEQAWVDALEAEGMIDTADHPGLLVLEGPSGLFGSELHYHCYVPLYLGLEDKAIRERGTAVAEAAVSASLEKPWSVLCISSRNTMNLWFIKYGTAGYRSYVQAALPHWELLDAEGARYCWDTPNPERLWALPIPLKLALVNLGVPLELVREPLPAGGLSALVARAGRSVASDLVDLATSYAALRASRAAGTMQGQARPPQAQPGGVPTTTEPDYIPMSDQMIAAMRANDPATVQRLIEAGESIDASDMDSLRSPLLWAAEHGHTNLVRFLLDRGTDIEDRADEGESPLMLAAYHGHRDVVRLLLERGADPTYRTGKGWDVVDFAELGEHDDVAALLRGAQGGQP